MKTKLTFLIMFCMVVILASAVISKAQTPAKVTTNQPSELQLSDAQLEAIKVIKTRAAKLAAPQALHLALTTKRVYQNMLREKEDPTLRAQLSADMHRTAAELLTIKGQSIREVLHVLTSDQKKFLKSEMGKPDAPVDLMELIERTFNVSEK